MSEPRKSPATLLVEIANELYTFGRVSEQRRHPGDPEPVTYVFAMPKSNPGLRRPLPDIRPDLAAVYEAAYGTVPGASALATP